MTMQYDVKSANISASGSVYGARARVKGILVTPTSTAGSVVLKDGGSGGTARITLNSTTDLKPFYVAVPGEGVLFDTNVYGTLTNIAAITVFYG